MEIDGLTGEYTQSLLAALLSGTHQCWLIFNEENVPCAMGITCILEENLTGIKCLHVDAFCSYDTLSEELARDATEYVKHFAIASGCKQIRALTNHSRAVRLLEMVGFVSHKTEYLLNCG
jgi:N-acetylglutamate synthase-like GNAT family acetyltransferase